MFVVLITYIKPIEDVDQYLVEHRAYLEEGYKNDYFVASGPQNPRTGGVLISQLADRGQLEAVIQNDPFKRNGIASYQVIEFNPVKYHKNFASFISAN